MSLPLVRAEPPERVTPPVHGPRPAPRLPTSQPLPLRTRVAVALARAVTALVRLLGRDGAVIGGRVAGLLDPRALARLAAGRTVVLVTGTNGKTTTTSMIVRACGGAGVATNDRGANMPDGVLSALLDAPDAALVVTEVDESYLGEVAAATDPAVIVVLNLSRDQLDRVGEVRALAGWVGDAVAAHPRAITVALADDVLTAGVGRRATRPVWVSCPAGPAAWRGDAGVCPRCAGSVRHDRAPAGATWVCRRCGLVPPLGDWTVDGEDLEGPDGVRHPARLGLPGRVNHLNAGFAVAVAGVLGVPADVAVARLASLEQVGGRYRVVERAGARIRLLLAKNPAGWLPTLDLLGQRPPGRVVIAVNDREADGRDVSWLWDVPFEQLAGQGHRVVATGDRVADLSVRLAYAGVDHAVAPDLRGALHGAGGGAEVDVVGNYTAFGDAERMLA